ncbi:MAG: cupin domain-containing protein [Burkholderiales bacterium]
MSISPSLDTVGPPALNEPTPMLGGLSPAAFMRRHWHKQPLLVRQAFTDLQPPVTRAELFRLAARDDVESRLVTRSGNGPRAAWSLQCGPLPRRSLLPIQQPGWTLLVQGLDLHVPAAHALLNRFRFIPQARLDDLMISWASAGGGVGPHFDSYDVFLIQVHGRRRWRIGRMADARLRPNLPVKIIANFRPEQEWVLEPGDMLYLPPGWAHDGDAVDGDCMTCSVGFRSARRDELARETLLRLADDLDDTDAGDIYRDPGQAATDTPGRLPEALLRFARQGLRRALDEPGALARALGEYLSEPKPQVCFSPGASHDVMAGVRLDARSCMLYDDDHVFLNGESWRAGGRDAQTLHVLADRRHLAAGELRGASKALKQLLATWLADGWLQVGG